MSFHNWVELRYMPVSAEMIDDGKVAFTASEEAMEIAESDLHVVCWDCKKEPTVESLSTPCDGGLTQDELSQM